MKYKVNDLLPCLVETNSAGKKKILNNPPEGAQLSKEKFKILRIDPVCNMYVVLIDDDMIGWHLGEWHHIYWGLDKKYIGKKFFEVFIKS